MVATHISETARVGHKPEDIALVVTSLYDAWQQRDEALIRSHFSRRPDLKIWGTGLLERLVGRQSIDRDFANWIATCPPWVSIDSTHRSMDVRGEMAWVADDIEARWRSGRQPLPHYHHLAGGRRGVAPGAFQLCQPQLSSVAEPWRINARVRPARVIRRRAGRRPAPQRTRRRSIRQGRKGSSRRNWVARNR